MSEEKKKIVEMKPVDMPTTLDLIKHAELKTNAKYIICVSEKWTIEQVGWLIDTLKGKNINAIVLADPELKMFEILPAAPVVATQVCTSCGAIMSRCSHCEKFKCPTHTCFHLCVRQKL